MKAAASPDAFVSELTGWQSALVTQLRSCINSAAEFDETIKWGNLVFFHNGPCILIHVEDHRVVLGFWRGKRLCGIAPAIKASGKYELGNIVIVEGDEVETEQLVRLAAEAAALNDVFGDPTAAVKG